MNISEVYNTDCLEYMRPLPDKAFALAIADPPYGIRDAGGQTGGSGKLKGRVFNNGRIDRWDKAPSAEFFDELRRVARNVIIWGATTSTCRPHVVLYHVTRCSRGRTSRRLRSPGHRSTVPRKCSGSTIGRATRSIQPRSLWNFTHTFCGSSPSQATASLTR